MAWATNRREEPNSSGFSGGPSACDQSESARPFQNIQRAYEASVMEGALRVPGPTPSGDVGCPSENSRAPAWQDTQATVPLGERLGSENSVPPNVPASSESAKAFDGSAGGGVSSGIAAMRSHWSREKRPSNSTGASAAGGAAPCCAASAARTDCSRASSVGADRTSWIFIVRASTTTISGRRGDAGSRSPTDIAGSTPVGVATSSRVCHATASAWVGGALSWSYRSTSIRRTLPPTSEPRSVLVCAAYERQVPHHDAPMRRIATDGSSGQVAWRS